jgi:iron-sulfur cluster assembly protein
MLTVSPAASEAIRGLVSSSELPEGAGVRIASSPDAPPGSLQMSLSDEPLADDQVVEQEGASVFLGSDVAELLDDKVLDAYIEDDQVGFAIVNQGEADSEQSEAGPEESEAGPEEQ